VPQRGQLFGGRPRHNCQIRRACQPKDAARLDWLSVELAVLDGARARQIRQARASPSPNLASGVAGVSLWPVTVVATNRPRKKKKKRKEKGKELKTQF